MTKVYSPYSKWNEEEINIALANEKKFHKEISDILKMCGYDRSPSAVRHLLNRLNKDSVSNKHSDLIETVNGRAPFPNYEPDNVSFACKSCGKVDATGPCNPPLSWVTTPIPSHSADRMIIDDFGVDYWNALTDIETERERLFNMISKEYAHIGNPKGKLFKVVSISDLHIPFVNDAVVKDMLEKHSDADILVLNGDLLEQYSVSKWPKSKGIVLKHEYQIAVKYIQLFAKHFKRVVLTRGNHDERVAKYFSTNLDPGVSFLTHPDPLERIAKGFDFTPDGTFAQIHKFDNVSYFGGLCGWWAKVGKTIFAHPSGGSGVPMRTGINVANYFFQKEDFDCVVLGHTHKLGSIVYKGKLVIEQGCACIPMDYEADSKMQYGQQSFGYAVIYMNSKGEVDFDKSRPVYYGTATCIDTDVRLNVGE
jgi:predicted phosphodiesterase